MNELFNLSGIDDSERVNMGRQRIDFNKMLSKLSTKSRKDSKQSKCLYCQCETTKFCNSHTVPASILKNIAVQGEIYTNNKIIDLPLLDKEKGVGNSGTFHVICRNCDSKIFQEYENSSNYENEPTSKMIAQIAMKNHLRSIGKRRFEIALFKNAENELLSDDNPGSYPNGYFDQLIAVSKLDLNEYIRGFKRAKKVIEKGWDKEYYLFYYDKLHYKAPIAFQGEVVLNFDFNGMTINNVYNKNSKYKIQSLHVSVFPLESATIVMLFIDKNDKRYRKFYKHFKKLNREDKLATVNYIIFSLSEDVYMSKDVHDSFIDNDQLKRITGLTSINFSDVPGGDSQLLKENFDFSEMNSIPNFLLMGNDIL